MSTKKFVVGLLSLIILGIAIIYCLYLGNPIEAVILALFASIATEHLMDSNKEDHNE